MGLFSWQCKKCDHSIKAPYNVPSGWDYMTEAVLLEADGTTLIGLYDGYGRIEGMHGEYEINWGGEEPELWHKKCWDSMDNPPYTGGSESAEDQGYFYNDPSEEQLEEAIRATE